MILYLADAVTRGYCVISRKHRTAARVDRADWREYMAQQHAPWDPEGDGRAWVDGLDQGGHTAADGYRRVYSQDRITVPEEWLKSMPKSSGTTVGFRHLTYHMNTPEVQQQILMERLKYA